MARYFFNTHSGKVHLDQEGCEMASLMAVRSEAVRAAGEALRDLEGGFWQHGEWWMWVTSEQGETVCTLRFSADPGCPVTFSQH